MGAVFAGVPSCLGVSNDRNGPDNFRSSVSPHPSLWCGLTAAACVNAAQHLNDPSYSYQHAAGSTSQGDVLAQSRLPHGQDTIESRSSGDDFDHSERRHAIYMLPVQLLRHVETLQQDVAADTWHLLWDLYPTEDVLPGASQLALSVCLPVFDLSMYASVSVCVCSRELGYVWQKFVCLPVKADCTIWF